MNWSSVIPIIVAVAVAFTGWFVVHKLNVSRDEAAKRREIRVQYLLEAYRNLEHSANREDRSQRLAFENAIADIQLLGSIEQVVLAQAVGETLASQGTVRINDLLESLRRDLRAELNLEPVQPGIKAMRFRQDATDTSD